MPLSFYTVWRIKIYSKASPADELHKKISRFSPKSKKPAPIAANRVIKLLSKMMSLCELWEYREKVSNPCEGITLNPENSRKRFLDPEKNYDSVTGKVVGPGELERFLKACTDAIKNKSENPKVIYLFLTILATGARRGEIQFLKKSEIDLNKCIITKEDHKGRRHKQVKPKIIDLNSLSVNLLRHVLQNYYRLECEWVFESHKRKGEPYSNLHKPKTRLIENAEIEDFRIHDLRHTFTSLLYNSNTSVEILMDLLGHSDYRTTKDYIHRFKKHGNSKSEAVSGMLGKFLDIPEVK